MRTHSRFRRNDELTIDGVDHTVQGRVNCGNFMALMLRKRGSRKVRYFPESSMWDMELQGRVLKCPAPEYAH